MHKAVQTVIDEFEKRAGVESKRMSNLDPDEFQRRLDEFLLSVGPATGQLINLLVKGAEAKTVLEVGSSYGYSTIWLAEAARETGGKVISLELHAGKQEHAREAIARAGLAKFVDFRLGDAAETIPKVKGPIDFVLLDLWKSLYISCFDLFYPKLASGALVVADNMIYPEGARPAAAAYRKHVRAKRGIESIMLTVGSGLEVSRFSK
jgi:predicted O-methyltransferase YrrM